MKTRYKLLLIIIASFIIQFSGCKEKNNSNPRDYQLEVSNDSTIIWDGDRKVAVLPYNKFSSLDSAINEDNQ